jgi:iron complex outermembrane receptor protein
MRERQSAAYVMANLEGERWSGNVGLRFVQTRVNADIPTPIPAGVCARAAPGQPAIPCAAYPGAITTSGDLQQYYDDETAFSRTIPATPTTSPRPTAASTTGCRA